MRITEEIDPVVTIVAEADFDALRSRLKRQAQRTGHTVPYLQSPIEGNRRAVILDASYEGPAEPVADLPALLVDLEHRRDRKDKRKLSSGGLRSREAVEAEVYDRPAEEPVERSVIGFWNSRMAGDIAHAGEWLAAACDTFGADYEPSPLGVIVTAHRHDPAAEKLWSALKVHWLEESLPWYEGGPAPDVGEPGWKSYQKIEMGQRPNDGGPTLAEYEAWIPEVA